MPRLPVPRRLRPAQAAVWRGTVAALPADWFSPADAPSLGAYCTHVARRGELETLLAKVDPAEDLERYAELARLIAAESGQLLRFARALRVVPSARTHAVSAARALEREVPADAVRPWAWTPKG